MASSTNNQRTLVTLMLPQLMVVLNLAMVSVALPAIRETFDAPADLMAWVVTIYTLPYVALMPLYGRLGDDLGTRRMLLVGAVVFLAGTALNVMSQGLPLLLVGRFIQGLGASGVVPLAIAMITHVFHAETRGRALGQWNSIGPVASVTGTLIGGVIIERAGWRAIFFAPLLAGAVTLYMVSRVMRTPKRDDPAEDVGALDWAGVSLLSATLTGFLFYISSEPITGRPPLTDWRLLLITFILLGAFVRRERRTTSPFIDISILSDATLVKASACAAMRMFVMSGTAFLTPLFLADVKALGAAAIGTILMTRSLGLFPTMYYGGRVADRWGSRRPIALGLGVQAASILFLIFSGTGAGTVWVIVGLLLNGLGAGLALPAMHRAAMGDGERGGAAAGLYSMIRFWGMMLGTAIAGVLLQALLDRGLAPASSYSYAYAATVVVGVAGVVTALTLRGGD